jgi:hypothetical protein
MKRVYILADLIQALLKVSNPYPGVDFRRKLLCYDRPIWRNFRIYHSDLSERVGGDRDLTLEDSGDGADNS